MLDRKPILSTLWIVAFAFYVYADIAGLMYSVSLRQYLSGTVDGVHISEGFLLGSMVLMTIPISMILLSRVLRYRANRIANIVAATVMTLIQAATLFVGSGPTTFYVYASAVEIAATAFIVWYAVTWPSPETARSPEPARVAVADETRRACGGPGQPACDLR